MGSGVVSQSEVPGSNPGPESDLFFFIGFFSLYLYLL